MEKLGWWNFVVQSLSHVQLFMTPWTVAHQAPLSSTISRRLLKFMSIEPVMPSNHLILCRPLLLLPSIFPSIRVFFKELAFCIRWPKYWSFFRTDCSDLLAVEGTLKSLLQHHNSKASVLWGSSLYGPTLTSIHDYWKNCSFDCTDLVGKPASLLFSMLSRFCRSFSSKEQGLQLHAR